MEQLQKTHCLAVFWTALDSGSRFSSLFLGFPLKEKMLNKTLGKLMQTADSGLSNNLCHNYNDSYLLYMCFFTVFAAFCILVIPSSKSTNTEYQMPMEKKAQVPNEGLEQCQVERAHRQFQTSPEQPPVENFPSFSPRFGG